MKNKWSNYAIKDGKVKSSYFREYCNRKKVGKAGKTSNCNSNEQSGQEQTQAQKKVESVYSEPTYYVKNIDPIILNDSWIVTLRGIDEEIGEKNTVDSYQQGQQGIQATAERRSEVEERDSETFQREEKMKEKDKMTIKEKKHEAKESKAYEKKEDKKESKKESKPKKK